MTLGENRLGLVLDRNRNGLNAIRLFLAVGVILWHSFPLTGRDIEWEPLRQLLGAVWVDGFFAISGFLIVSSWLSTPRPGRFVAARVLRIFPAFYVCLLVTALFIVPVGVLISGADRPLWSTDSVTYVVKNSLLWIFQRDIAGVMSGNPFPGTLNGSLWTLVWEFFCYMGVLALGVAKLLHRRLTIPLCFAASWLVLLVAALGFVETNLIHYGARLAVAFTAGALVYVAREHLPVSKLFVGLSGAAVVASAALPEYTLLAAPFLAYFLISLGAVIKHERLVLRNDISYGMYIYAFPIQQTLALVGLATLPLWVFVVLSVVCTVPLAILSWVYIEQPAMKLRGRMAVRERLPAGTPG